MTTKCYCFVTVLYFFYYFYRLSEERNPLKSRCISNLIKYNFFKYSYTLCRIKYITMASFGEYSLLGIFDMLSNDFLRKK